MISRTRARPDRQGIAVLVLAGFCFALWTWTSYARWASFAYRTFDLAYYVQAIWQLIHGRFHVSVQYVPLLGNHVEPIVFLAAPFFFVFRHPMLFVAMQNAGLATMGPVGYSIARRLGLTKTESMLMAAALLFAPATGFIALHEFHPEALTAPFLLLMLRAYLTGSVRQHWLWFIAVLACKENMAPLLAGYCLVQCLVERRLGFAHLRRWFIIPMGVAIGWFVLCSKVITPALNSGNIDYAALYDRLGANPIEILLNLVKRPELFAHALGQSVIHGNLVWGLFLPLLFLPVLRPKWLLISAPIFLQHLLSWRSSEWTIYFHYAAPILPLLWFAAVEAIPLLAARPAWARVRSALPWLILTATFVTNGLLGPTVEIAATTRDWFAHKSERARKGAFIAKIPARASVLAPLPYLSHLAMREELHSLHYVLKGLKTLSRQSFEAIPATDFVLIDYRDIATFDSIAGYYHPQMRTADGRVVPSSDRLLHDFLARSDWQSESTDELTLLRRVETKPDALAASDQVLVEMTAQTRLAAITKSREVIGEGESFDVTMSWRFRGEREVFPWMALQLTAPERSQAIILMRGLCAPEVKTGPCAEMWRVSSAARIPPGTYQLEALFFDNTKRSWSAAHGKDNSPTELLCPPVSLGSLKVSKSPEAPK